MEGRDIWINKNFENSINAKNSIEQAQFPRAAGAAAAAAAHTDI